MTLVVKSFHRRDPAMLKAKWPSVAVIQMMQVVQCTRAQVSQGAHCSTRQNVLRQKCNPSKCTQIVRDLSLWRTNSSCTKAHSAVWLLLITVLYFYPAIRSIRWDTKFTVAFTFFVYSYRFLSRCFALPIGLKFCVAVWPHIRQAFSHFGGIVPGMAEFWASAGAIWRDVLFAELKHFFVIAWDQFIITKPNHWLCNFTLSCFTLMCYYLH